MKLLLGIILVIPGSFIAISILIGSAAEKLGLNPILIVIAMTILGAGMLLRK